MAQAGRFAEIHDMCGLPVSSLRLQAQPSQPGPWEPPNYADPEKFDEQDVVVGSGQLAVPGTLSLPRQPGVRPAVVLLGGSGPGDRDETLGRNKPFKDLA